MRVLSLLSAHYALHTGHMAIDARATTLVTGAAGFIGTELVKVLTARGHQVFGLTRFREGAEDAPPRPAAWGRCLAPALDRLDGYLIAGLPIVTAFPGWVYGDGSWCRTSVIEPTLAGRRVLQLGKAPWVSPFTCRTVLAR